MFKQIQYNLFTSYSIMYSPAQSSMVLWLTATRFQGDVSTQPLIVHQVTKLVLADLG